MRILGRAKIIEFAKKHAAARKRLTAWMVLTAAANWKNLAELKATFPSADYVGGSVVFNIGGNRYRLMAMVDYQACQVVIEEIFTHAEYDKGTWKR